MYGSSRALPLQSNDLHFDNRGQACGYDLRLVRATARADRRPESLGTLATNVVLAARLLGCLSGLDDWADLAPEATCS